MVTMNQKREEQLEKFQKQIQYNFQNIKLLNKALTHSSYSNNRSENLEHNERLEFLGDSILSFIISLHLYEKCSDISEGQLTRIRANIVCEQSLHKTAINLNLGTYILMSKGEINTGGRNRTSILADAVEAIIASIFLDGGIERAREFVIKNLNTIISDAINNKIFSDYKSYLQEITQKDNMGELEYKLIDEKGPDHDKIFEIGLFINNEVSGKGFGRSKKDAQQQAAKDAIDKLGIKYE